MNFHQSISSCISTICPLFSTISPPKRLVVGSLLITSSISWYDQVCSQISLSHILIMPPFYHPFFLVNVPSRFAAARSLPDPWRSLHALRCPHRRKPRPVVPGWMIAVGFHYTLRRWSESIHIFDIGESPTTSNIRFKGRIIHIIHYIWEYPQLID